MKKSTKAVLVNKQQQFAALIYRASREENFEWRSGGIGICLEMRKDWHKMSTCESVFCRSFNHSLAGLKSS